MMPPELGAWLPCLQAAGSAQRWTTDAERWPTSLGKSAQWSGEKQGKGGAWAVQGSYRIREESRSGPGRGRFDGNGFHEIFSPFHALSSFTSQCGLVLVISSWFMVAAQLTPGEGNHAFHGSSRVKGTNVPFPEGTSTYQKSLMGYNGHHIDTTAEGVAKQTLDENLRTLPKQKNLHPRKPVSIKEETKQPPYLGFFLDTY